ncbi:MAG: hypothetical protein H0T80_13985 [Betaproteobacteria bacterium]|nr:hypothetical protein [Betaproteobacteria bacterium]
MARALADKLPHATLATIEGYGTFFFIEKPELFRAKAGRFLREQSATG